MATPPKGNDRRTQKTHQSLQQAFIQIVEEKGFIATSVQDIIERARVSRGTFYAHFADKYSLWEIVGREHFRNMLLRTLPTTSQWNKTMMHLLIQTVLQYFKTVYQQCHPSHITAPLIERIIQEELAQYLLNHLKQREKGDGSRRVPMATIAQITSWGIYGAAIQWVQNTTTISAEQMAHDVLLTIVDGMAMVLSPNLAE